MSKSLSEMAFARLIMAYMADARAEMNRLAAVDSEYNDGAHYIEMLADSLINRIRTGKDVCFESKDLGL